MKIVLKCIAASLVALVLIFGLPAMLLLGSMRQVTELERIPSPDGSRTAILISEDHGATGGATIVAVEENGKRTEIYHGRWADAFEMEIAWKGNDCLLINGKEYPIE